MKRFTIYLLLIFALGCSGKLGLRGGSEGHADGEVKFWLKEKSTGAWLVDTSFVANGAYLILFEISQDTTFVHIEGAAEGE